LLVKPAADKKREVGGVYIRAAMRQNVGIRRAVTAHEDARGKWPWPNLSSTAN